jgi:hypothetical protein
MSAYEGDAPRYRSGEWRRLFPAAGFGALRERRFPHSHSGPPGQVIIDRVLSVSFIAALDERHKQLITTRLTELLATSPELAGRSQITVPYETCAFSCARL